MGLHGLVEHNMVHLFRVCHRHAVECNSADLVMASVRGEKHSAKKEQKTIDELRVVCYIRPKFIHTDDGSTV